METSTMQHFTAEFACGQAYIQADAKAEGVTRETARIAGASCSTARHSQLFETSVWSKACQG
eukprot:3338687-Amphidinium_carterae.1